MKISTRTIQFYNDFKCLGENCPCTCCKGWLVPVDDEAYSKYLKLGGITGIKAFLSCRTKLGIRVFNKYMKECPFHMKNGLCELQSKYGEEYLCKVCKRYPRIIYNLGVGAHRILDLSCPEAAKLFIDNIEDISFYYDDIEINDELYGTNDDKQYFEFICELLDTLCEVISNSKCDIFEIYGYLLALSKEIQNVFIHEEKTTDAVLKAKELLTKIKPDECTKFVISAENIDRIMTGGYYHARLKRESEFLYSLCKLYFKHFDKMLVPEIDNIFSNMHKGINEGLFFDIQLFLKKHLIYIISESYMEVYEDYSFFRKIVMAIIRSQMLMMFIWLYSNDVKKITEKELCQILYSFHRRDGSNSGLFADFYNIIIENQKI